MNPLLPAWEWMALPWRCPFDLVNLFIFLLFIWFANWGCSPRGRVCPERHWTGTWVLFAEIRKTCCDRPPERSLGGPARCFSKGPVEEPSFVCWKPSVAFPGPKLSPPPFLAGKNWDVLGPSIAAFEMHETQD